MSSNELASIQLTIGMRIYIVRFDKMQVIPAHVIERVRRETLQGIETSYIFDFQQTGNNAVSSTQLSNRYDVIATSLTEAYDALKAHIDAEVEHTRNEKIAAARIAVEQGFNNCITRFGNDAVHEQAFDKFTELVKIEDDKRNNVP